MRAILSRFVMMYTRQAVPCGMVDVNPLNQKIRISPDVIFQPVLLGEALLLNVKTLTYFAFDELGSRFWLAIRETGDTDRAMDQVAAQSGRPRAEIQPRLTAILGALEKSGLVELEVP